jgi:MFS superfamily sulfate permease-like transporter
MTNKLIELSLFSSALLGGFYAGTGFFVAMGGNPAIKLMSDRTFAEYWQHTDHFMAARMKIFGPLLLLIMLLGVVALLKEWRTSSFWFMMAAFAILVTDVSFTLSTNHPLNSLVQSWDLNNLPSNVQDIKWKIVHAFNIRTVFMISSFVMVLSALWFRRTR